MNPNDIERAKNAAAVLAVRENLRNNMILGIGSGSTIIGAVREIANIVNSNNWNIICVPTSYQAKSLITEKNLFLGSLDQYPELDLAIDGVDEITYNLEAIKGGGGCLVQEKIIATCAKRVIAIGDWRKISNQLGENWKKGVPVEIIPEAQVPLTHRLEKMGGKAKLREGKAKIGPLITDNGNFILDVDFGKISDPEKLDSQLKSLTGVVDSGLFIKIIDKVYIGLKDGNVEILD